MGRAAEILGVTPAFLRALGVAKLIEPLRSEGGIAASPATSSAWPSGLGSSSTPAPGC
jgi:hypothetical protein